MAEQETRPQKLETLDQDAIAATAVEYINNSAFEHISGDMLLRDAIEEDPQRTYRRMLEEYFGNSYLVNGFFLNASKKHLIEYAQAMITEAFSINQRAEYDSFFSLD